MQKYKQTHPNATKEELEARFKNVDPNKAISFNSGENRITSASSLNPQPDKTNKLMSLIANANDKIQNGTTYRKTTPEYQQEREAYDAMLANDLRNFKYVRRRNGEPEMTPKEEREWIKAYKKENQMPASRLIGGNKKPPVAVQTAPSVPRSENVVRTLQNRDWLEEQGLLKK